MKLIDLLIFIESKDVECHIFDSKTGEELNPATADDERELKIISMIPNCDLESFCELIKEYRKLNDDGLEFVLKNGYFCLDLAPIIDYFDIDIDDVLKWICIQNKA